MKMSIERNSEYEEEEAHYNSALGTKEYWDSHYNMELSNFEDTGDEGEIWFGKTAENRMLRFVCEKIAKTAAVLDVGTGNGSILRKLRQKGYTDLTGLDYSEGAVELARKAAEAEQREHSTKLIADLISNKTPLILYNRFDAVLDKGTWDAISLAGDRTARIRNYRRSIIDFFKKSESDEHVRPTTHRYFVIFSCNFTKDELVDLFECEDLIFDSEIMPTNTISFGGKEGTTSTGVAFRKE